MMNLDKLTKEEQLQLLTLLDDQKKLEDVTNPPYLPLYTNKSRYLVLMGGGGSGKSIFAGQKVLRRLTTEEGHRILVVRKVAKTLRESCFQQLRGQITEYYNYLDFDVNKTDMKITYKPNGNVIIFGGLDDVEKMKSIYNITCIWIEEASELDVGDYRQLDIRLRGETKHYKQMIFSFNPVSITHWLKTEFFDVEKEDTTTMHTTYLDNKFLDAEAIKVLEGFKDTDPYYYAVYCKGEWGVLGKTVFDGEKVTNRIIALRGAKLGTKGRFENVKGEIKFVEDINGFWTVYRHPTKKQRFVAGVDVAEGNEWGDYNATHIIDTVNYEQYCVFHGHCDLDIYAEELCKAGYYYNKALLIPEVNFNPGLVLNLQRLKYPRIYLRQVQDTITHQIQKKFGFRTDKYNRQAIITDLVEFVRDHVNLINDIKTLEEMLTFVRDEKGKPQAQEGKHDDLVMALAIALHGVISGQGGTYIDEFKPDISKLPIDCQEDWENATEEQRKRLAEKWGL